jgi:hypothetical protein
VILAHIFHHYNLPLSDFFMIKFLVVAPQYQARSGGVMVLHELCDALNKKGYPCGIVFLHGGNAAEQNFQFAFSDNNEFHMPGGQRIEILNNTALQEILNTGTVIYPDLINGNPLGAKKIIRFILNFNENSFDGEYILSFSKIYSNYANYVLFKPFRNSFFNDKDTKPWDERNLNLTYFGKGPSFIDCKLIPDTLLLERDWPRDKNQLSILLKQCKFLFTWDCVSSTLHDAIMCGAIPVLLHDQQIPRILINQMEIGSYPDIRFNSIEDLPLGISFDSDSVNSSISEFKYNYNYLADSWVERVGEFAKAYIKKISRDL